MTIAAAREIIGCRRNCRGTHHERKKHTMTVTTISHAGDTFTYGFDPGSRAAVMVFYWEMMRDGKLAGFSVDGVAVA